jgi:hypothetical protein
VPDQTDVFVVGDNGQLRVFYVEGSGTWQSEEIGSPGG